ncbi:MAG TPA: hypothetical protein VGC91_10790 [Pyrinomonadaceae bacterium]|jgi:hypothetical protein
MKGYFFRLAQQTKLRLKPQANSAQQQSGGRVEPRAASSTGPSHSQKPLHQEETVYVSGPHTASSSDASRQSDYINAPLSLKKQAVETSSREHNFSTETAKNFSARDANRRGFEFQESATDDAGRKSQASFDASTADARLQAQDARVRIEQPATSQETFKHQEGAHTLQSSEADAQSAASSITSVSREAFGEPAAVEARETLIKTEPEHFRETASLLESGVTDKELLQRVFFREIHEWIAAPVETVAETVSREPPPAREENMQRISLIEPDESAATQLFRAQARERERLEQHDLSLSIGSISIVIEEPPQQAQPQPVQTQPRAETSSSQSSREFSRLSRHYIR